MQAGPDTYVKLKKKKYNKLGNREEKKENNWGSKTKKRKIPKLKGSEKSKKRKGDLHVLATR
jgi:hypothetical protein